MYTVSLAYVSIDLNHLPPINISRNGMEVDERKK